MLSMTTMEEDQCSAGYEGRGPFFSFPSAQHWSKLRFSCGKIEMFGLMEADCAPPPSHPARHIPAPGDHSLYKSIRITSLSVYTATGSRQNFLIYISSTLL